MYFIDTALLTLNVIKTGCLAVQTMELFSLLAFQFAQRQPSTNVPLSAIPRWTKCTVSFDLLHDLLPGPVTAVLERGVDLNSQLNPGNPLVGIRVPAHSFMRKLVARCGYPLALTSANVSNTTSTLAVEVGGIQNAIDALQNEKGCWLVRF